MSLSRKNENKVSIYLYDSVPVLGMHARRKQAWARRWDSYPWLRSYVGLRKAVRR